MDALTFCERTYSWERAYAMPNSPGAVAAIVIPDVIVVAFVVVAAVIVVVVGACVGFD